MKKYLFFILIVIVTTEGVLAQSSKKPFGVSFFKKVINTGQQVINIIPKGVSDKQATVNPSLVSKEEIRDTTNINYRDKNGGWKSIHQYAKEGNEKKIQEAIETGMYVNIPTQKSIANSSKIFDDYTPLMLAAQHGHLQTCKLLLLYGADPLLKNAENKTAIDLAKYKGFIEIEKALRKNDFIEEDTKGWMEYLKTAQEAYFKGEYIIANSYSCAAFNKITKESAQRNPEYLTIINCLADSYDKMAVFSKEEFYLNQSLELNEKKFGSQSSGYITSLVRLTTFFNKIAYYDKSKLLLEILNELSEKPEIGNTLSHATIMDANGFYFLALNDKISGAKWFEKSLILKKKIVGEESYEYGITLLGFFKTREGEWNNLTEEKASKKIHSLFDNLIEEGIKKQIDPLISLAFTEEQKRQLFKDGILEKDYKQAANEIGKIVFKPLVMQGREEIIFTVKSFENIIPQIKKIDGEYSVNYLMALKFLCFAYRQNKELVSQTTMLIKSIESKIAKINYQRGLAYFPDPELEMYDYYLPLTLSNRFNKSLDYLEYQKNAIEKTYGKIHPSYLNTLAYLSGYHTSKGNKALGNLYGSQCKLLINFLKSHYAIPEIGVETYYLLFPEIEMYRNNAKSFILSWASKKDIAVSFLYDFILNDKQRLLFAYQKFRKGEVQNVINLVNDYESSLNTIGASYNDLGGFTKEKHAETVLNLDIFAVNLVSYIEQSFGVKSSTDEEDTKLIGKPEPKFSWQQIQKSMKKGEVAVEYFYLDKSKLNADSTTVDYYALILRPFAKTATLKYLFKQDELKAQLNYNNQSDLINLSYRGDPQVINQKKQNKNTGKNLYQLCWEKVESSIEKTDTAIYYSPAGLLHQVSFAAISTPNQKSLSEKYRLNYLSSTQKLLEPTKSIAFNKNTSVAIFGNPPTNLQTLSGASNEILNIKSILLKKNAKVDLFEGKNASEENFKTVGLQLKSPRIVHIATHAKYNNTDSLKVLKPLMKSYLLFANANTDSLKYIKPGHKNDGILTALEVSGLNFVDTKMVVLSACQTGLGEDGGDEGVIGLQRAFKIAGAEYILASLWSVPDKETSEMMGYFYKNLSSGITITKSFEMAQTLMKSQYAPYYWGAFVLMR